jgi:hypothetical protein
MTTPNKCKGTVHTCKVDFDGFGTTQDFIKTQQARLDRLKRQWYEWTAKYSGGAKTSEEYAQAYGELADMTEELGKIHKMSSMSGVFAQGGASVAAEAETLGSSMASQYNILLTRDLPSDLPGVQDARRENALRAWGMMKSGGFAGAAGIMSKSRIQSMRDVASSLRRPKPNAAPANVAKAIPPGTAINGLPVIRIGRWMTKAEYEAMKKTGKVQNGAGDATYGATSGPESFGKQAAPGSVYVEYDVLAKNVIPGSKPDWVMTIGPGANNMQRMQLLKQGGEFSPPATNISEILKTK